MERAMSFDVIGMLVDLFKERGFTVAFKGIDNEELEETAISLGADFLQGEKYTKPFPIDEMTRQMELKALF
jgi:EAL domain-containing protein (putative c-di-GMP-specific phosphodiesterase class I)